MDFSKLISETNGKIFTVEFIKRTTGELRVMNCRTGVFKHLTGGGAKYSFEDKGLISVFDLKNNGYRTIPKENIKSVIFGGIRHEAK